MTDLRRRMGIEHAAMRPLAAVTPRPRRGHELIDAAFAMLRVHYAAFVPLALLASLPALAIDVVTGIGGQAEPGVMPMLATLTAWFVCGSVAQVAIGVAAADAYHGRPVDPAGALRRTLRRIWRVVGVTILANVLVGLGLIFFIIPGLIIYADLFAAPLITVLEDAGGDRALVRSSELVKGHRGRILLTVGLTALLTTMLAAAAGALIGWALVDTPIVAGLLAGIFGVVLTPINACVVVLAYFDARIRLEGYDIELLEEQIGTSGAPAAQMPAPP